MFRAKTREELCQIANDNDLPVGRFTMSDGNGGTLIVTSRGGDIGICCVGSDQKTADVVFSGSGYQRPLVREALNLLMLAIKEEGGDVGVL